MGQAWRLSDWAPIGPQTCFRPSSFALAYATPTLPRLSVVLEAPAESGLSLL